MYMSIGIYKITNPKNKVYVGQSINIEKRLISHKNKQSKTTVLIYNSIKKYGSENHKFEIIEECKIENLTEREIYWTLYNNAIFPNGLVLKIGQNKGSFVSNATKIKMSKAHIGKKDSNETKLNKSKSAKGKIKNEIWRYKISKSHPTKKQINQYDLNGIEINNFISLNEASRHTGIRVVDISAVCNNKQKTTYGYIFKFKEDKNLTYNLSTYKGKSIIQYDLNMNPIKEWNSISEASLKLNINCGNISSVLTNKQKTAGGFKWKYK